jgi:hypothetical protein
VKNPAETEPVKQANPFANGFKLQDKHFTNGKATDIAFNANMRIEEIRQLCQL